MGEDYSLTLTCPFYDLIIKDIVHDHEFLNSFLFSDSYELLIKRDWPISIVKVEESFVKVYSTEESDILVIREGGTQSHYSDILLSLFLLSQGPSHNGFQNRSSLIIQ
jgi:hypothetical protein